MGIKLSSKPLSETVLGRVNRNYLLMKNGIDPKTKKEKEEDKLKLKQAKRWFEKTRG